MKTLKNTTVVPAQAGTHAEVRQLQRVNGRRGSAVVTMDSRLRGNDGATDSAIGGGWRIQA